MSKIWQVGQMPPQHPEIDRKPQSTPHQERISAAMRRLWRTRWKLRRRTKR
jgi:hypothetical protein